MLTRSEEKAIFESIQGDLIINTNQDGESGNNVTIPVNVFWGVESVKVDLPAIFLRFIIIDNPVMRTLGDLWRQTEDGDLSGFIGENVLQVKIIAVDYGSPGQSNFISKIDIAQALADRVRRKAMFQWDSLIEEGGIAEDNPISATNDVSEVFQNEQLKELQFSVKIRKLVGEIPEEGPLKFDTAPTMLSVKTKIIK